MPKKTKEKRRTRKRIQKGGTIYSFDKDANSKCLQHVGIGRSADNSCGACTVNQLGFPEDIVDALSNTAGKHDGVTNEQIINKINELKNKEGYRGRYSTNLYWWGTHSSNPEAVGVEKANRTPRPLEGNDSIKKAIAGVFGTLKNQTANILSIWWKSGGGHYVTMAKDSFGTPFIIESQGNDCAGLYTGLEEIYRYFTPPEEGGAGVPAFLGTFNNSMPFLGPNRKWTLDFNKELELDLSRFKRNTPKLVDQALTTYPMQQDNEDYGKDPIDDPMDWQIDGGKKKRHKKKNKSRKHKKKKGKKTKKHKKTKNKK